MSHKKNNDTEKSNRKGIVFMVKCLNLVPRPIQKIMIWEAQPFDTKISFPDSRYGEVVEKFSSGDLVIKCMDGLLLITNYEGNVESGDTF